MFSVVTPILLLGFGCLVIPIVIHLFNNSRGRIVEIGSIELLRKLKSSLVSEIKLRRLLLLTLRLIIFSLATLIIAQLFIKSDYLRSAKSLHLVSQAWLNSASDAELNALFKQQTQDKIIQLITNDFAALTSHEGVVITNNGVDNIYESLQLWPLLLDKITKTDQKAIDVYITNTFAGTDFAALNTLKPSLAKAVVWHIKTLDKPTATAIQKPFNIGIYWQSSRDISHLQTALQLIKKHQHSGLEVTLLDSKQWSELNVDALFYLSDEPVAVDLIKQVQQGMLLISDASSAQINSGYWQVSANSPLLNAAIVYQYSPLANQENSVNTENDGLLPQQWSLSNGALLLSKQQLGKGKHLKFASRFEDDWLNITRQAKFPAILLSLLAEQQKFSEFNQLALATAQMQLPAQQTNPQATIAEQHRYSLFNWCAIFLVFAWLLERFISERFYHGRR